MRPEKEGNGVKVKERGGEVGGVSPGGGYFGGLPQKGKGTSEGEGGGEGYLPHP